MARVKHTERGPNHVRHVIPPLQYPAVFNFGLGAPKPIPRAPLQRERTSDGLVPKRRSQPLRESLLASDEEGHGALMRRSTGHELASPQRWRTLGGARRA